MACSATFDAPEPEPSAVNTENHFSFVQVQNDRLTVEYIGKGSHSDVGSVQANRCCPTNRLLYYFEVEILALGERGSIGVGLSGSDFLLNRQPGTEPMSFGYRGDEGQKFLCSNQPEAYGPTFQAGDTIGCGVNWLDGTLFFTRNGTHLGVAASGSNFFPAFFSTPASGSRSGGQQHTTSSHGGHHGATAPAGGHNHGTTSSTSRNASSSSNNTGGLLNVSNTTGGGGGITSARGASSNFEDFYIYRGSEISGNCGTANTAWKHYATPHGAPSGRRVVPRPKLFPTVGLHCPGERIRFRFQPPFAYDIAQQRKTIVDEERMRILKVDLPYQHGLLLNDEVAAGGSLVPQVGNGNNQAEAPSSNTTSKPTPTMSSSSSSTSAALSPPIPLCAKLVHNYLLFGGFAKTLAHVQVDERDSSVWRMKNKGNTSTSVLTGSSASFSSTSVPARAKNAENPAAPTDPETVDELLLQASLPWRSLVRENIVKGNVREAMDILKANYPNFFELDSDLPFNTTADAADDGLEGDKERSDVDSSDDGGPGEDDDDDGGTGADAQEAQAQAVEGDEEEQGADEEEKGATKTSKKATARKRSASEEPPPRKRKKGGAAEGQLRLLPQALLYTQAFLELWRDGKVAEAVTFLRTEVAQLRSKIVAALHEDYSSGQEDGTGDIPTSESLLAFPLDISSTGNFSVDSCFEDACAVVAYKSAAAMPPRVKAMFHSSRRMLTADLVNARCVELALSKARRERRKFALAAIFQPRQVLSAVGDEDNDEGPKNHASECCSGAQINAKDKNDEREIDLDELEDAPREGRGDDRGTYGPARKKSSSSSPQHKMNSAASPSATSGDQKARSTAIPLDIAHWASNHWSALHILLRHLVLLRQDLRPLNRGPVPSVRALCLGG
ncbi:unnamed protein product [Amoebophrya sp. A120]|nr:unnamed protein product [Amoebophrya sp. A120]|eukprot:GSA120T00012190001.1